MKLRNPVVLGILVLSIGSLSMQAHARTGNNLSQGVLVNHVSSVWHRLDPSQRSMVDNIAADFFRNSLSQGQRIRIVQQARQQTNYHGGLGQQDQIMMSLTENLPARELYGYLNEEQKAPFRNYAIDKLGIRFSTAPDYQARQGSI